MYPNTFYRVSVKALIRDDNGNILVVKENQNTWSLPGGGLNHGEDPKDGVRRELKEGLGISDIIVNNIIKSTSFEVGSKQAWLLWVVYDVEIKSTDFILGDGVTEIEFIDVEKLKASDDIFEQKVYEIAKDKKIFRNEQDARLAYDHLVDIGRLTVKLANVKRAPKYLNGSYENDLEHSFHLSLSATELAANYFPNLDIGLVSQFSLVHDMPEVYTGDVWTFDISEEDRNKKEVAEKLSSSRLLKELPPHTAELLGRYEKQLEPEARFVRLVDKMMPDIMVMIGDTEEFKKDLKIKDAEYLKTVCITHSEKLRNSFPEFPFVHIIKDLCLEAYQKEMFK